MPHGAAPNSASAVPARVQWAVVLAALLLIWNSLGNHALIPPDEGRYGSVSAWMAEHGNWLSPQLRDHVHVTKPPLTYWSQAVGVLAFGRTELAVRLPSAIGATIMVLSLFWFARRVWGPAVAVLAVGVYAIMPLPLIVGRLGTTDSLLNAWWWLALCCGYMAMRRDARTPRDERTAHDERTANGERTPNAASPRTRLGWIVAFWCATALIGLTKGPLAVAPLGLVWMWLLLAGRWRDLWRTHAAIGLPIALVPLAVVAYLFWQSDPVRTSTIWRSEFVDRVAGTGVHHDPIWQLIPIFVGGLMPASLTIIPELFKRPVRRTWLLLRSGNAAALMVIATVAPSVGFSLLSGNQPTYLLPVAAPCAAVF
ncbi:MAG: glycosyltransferase family 39 protein, partial [Phycisphaerae bacterium]|nr:glycosyltransferase family 39 protein [Phycisphaerae bacterium]